MGVIKLRPLPNTFTIFCEDDSKLYAKEYCTYTYRWLNAEEGLIYYKDLPTGKIHNVFYTVPQVIAKILSRKWEITSDIDCYKAMVKEFLLIQPNNKFTYSGKTICLDSSLL